MSNIPYKKTSPYYNTPINTMYLDIWGERKIPEHPTDQLIEIEPKHEGRPDMLAFDLYGSTDYWWIFMVRNRNLIENPIYDLVAGLQIWVPQKNRLQTIIG
jgi:hypothetical protein